MRDFIVPLILGLLLLSYGCQKEIVKYSEKDISKQRIEKMMKEIERLKRELPPCSEPLWTLWRLRPYPKFSEEDLKRLGEMYLKEFEKLELKTPETFKQEEK